MFRRRQRTPGGNESGSGFGEAVVDALLARAQRDNEQLHALAAEGHEFSRFQAVEYRLVGDTRKEAEVVRDFVVAAGYGEAELERADGGRFVVRVHLPMPTTSNVVTCVSGFLTFLAQLYGLEVEGWSLLGELVERSAEHAVIVTLRLAGSTFGSPDEREAVRSLAGALERAVEAAGAGELDGDEFGGGSCQLFLYGPDADALFHVVEPVVRASPLARGGKILRRYGAAQDPEAREVSTEL